jgi:hypothetical protein
LTSKLSKILKRNDYITVAVFLTHTPPSTINQTIYYFLLDSCSSLHVGNSKILKAKSQHEKKQQYSADKNNKEHSLSSHSKDNCIVRLLGAFTDRLISCDATIAKVVIYLVAVFSYTLVII